MPKSVQITPDVRLALMAGEFSGPTERPVFKLNAPGMARPLYEAVNKVLVAMGGKWSRRDQGHVFDRPVDMNIANWAGAERVVDAKRTAEQFFTPPDVARKVWERAQLRRDHHILEPSAGEGALLELPIRMGCFITAVEKDEALARGLIAKVPHHGGGIWMGDFMEWTPVARAPIDVVLMNPPFSRNQDVLHVNRAMGFLRPGGRLVAIMSPHWTFANDIHSTQFREAVGQWNGDWHHLPAGSFKAADTGVNAGILTIVKGD